MIIYKIKELREQIKEWKKQGLTVGLVPTMGALHAGHLSLIKKSVEKCDRTVVSVFVNPIQFCPGEDLDKYPRTLDADEKLCNDAGVNIVFAPSPEENVRSGSYFIQRLSYLCNPALLLREQALRQIPRRAL